MSIPNPRLGLTLVVVLLASCGSDDAEVVEPAPQISTLPSGAETGTLGGKATPGTELCDASAYSGLVGTNVAATTFPVDPRIRVFGLNDIVTRDYIPQRTNIVHGEDGIITEVYCG